MPWYTYTAAYSSGSYSTINVYNVIAQPFKFNNIIFTYDNPHNLRSSLNYDYYKQLRSYIVDPGGSIIYSFLTTTSSGIDYVGFPNIIYSETPLNTDVLINKPSTFISGKYKYNNKNVSLMHIALERGSTLPIKTNINGVNYKYLVISSTNVWSHSGSKNTKYIGGYNTPYDIDHVSTPPADLTMNLISTGATINIDFGYTPQEIPQFVYDWFIQQFDKVYENTYTIKSITGSTLTTLTEAPPMTSATLSAVGNAKYLTLKGENNTNYTMEWTSETPQGKIFAGLATSKGGSIAIPVGETSTINLTESTDLYEVWQTYRPPTTTFEIKTYNYSGETSRVDKTDYLTPISTISGVLRGEASLLNFNVLIQSDTVPNFNYCYIDKFKRYYYVTEPVSVRQNLWEMTMQVDALTTYKDSLLKCEGYIDRNEYIQNKMIIDNNRAIMQGADFEEDTITNELFGSGTFALSGLRIGTKELP